MNVWRWVSFVLFLILLLFGTSFILEVTQFFRYTPAEVPEDDPDSIFLSEISIESDKQWIPILTNGTIRKIVPFNPYGLSEKFKITFENGMVASGKLMEPFSLWKKSFPVFDYNRVNSYHKAYSRRTWSTEQGWNELATFYVDRALSFFKKPPTAGRYITNRQLYENDMRFWARIKRLLPTYDIPVCLIAWYSGIKVRPPSTELQDLMILPNTSAPVEVFEIMSQISDVMIFDFLVDDHDRIEAHNWIKDPNGNYIFWDNGLAFRHGPHGKQERDMDIFCGFKRWVERYQPCAKICRFRSATIHMLKSLGKQGESKMSSLIHRELQTDKLSPIFNFGVYHPGRPQFPKVRYRSTNFYEGMEIRLRQVIDFVDTCVEKYGEGNVLLDPLPFYDQIPPIYLPEPLKFSTDGEWKNRSERIENLRGGKQEERQQAVLERDDDKEEQEQDESM